MIWGAREKRQREREREREREAPLSFIIKPNLGILSTSAGIPSPPLAL